MTNKKITVQLNRETGKKIKSLKITERESYNEIINRLINEHEVTVQTTIKNNVIITHREKKYNQIDLVNIIKNIYKLKKKLKIMKETKKIPTKKDYIGLLDMIIEYVDNMEIEK